MLSGWLVGGADPSVVACSLLGWTRGHGELLAPHLARYSSGYQPAMLLWWSQDCFSQGINCFFQAPLPPVSGRGTCLAHWGELEPSGS